MGLLVGYLLLILFNPTTKHTPFQLSSKTRTQASATQERIPRWWTHRATPWLPLAARVVRVQSYYKSFKGFFVGSKKFLGVRPRESYKSRVLNPPCAGNLPNASCTFDPKSPNRLPTETPKNLPLF